jgi:hypothetical protein
MGARRVSVGIGSLLELRKFKVYSSKLKNLDDGLHCAWQPGDGKLKSRPF